MPTARRTVNAFTAEEVERITGLSLHMINYLRRLDILNPAYGSGAKLSPKTRRRGSVRYYSYRDLVAAKLVQRLCANGVQLHKLKSAIKRVSREAPWTTQGAIAHRLQYIVSNGADVAWKSEDGFLDTFRADGQRAFAFVVNLKNLEGEVRDLVPMPKRKHFTMKNSPLLFEKLAKS